MADKYRPEIGDLVYYVNIYGYKHSYYVARMDRATETSEVTYGLSTPTKRGLKRKRNYLAHRNITASQLTLITPHAI